MDGYTSKTAEVALTSFQIRERTLYEYIGRAFSKYGCRYVTQVGLQGKEPDLVIEFDGSRVVSEVKIDMETKREEAMIDAYAKDFETSSPSINLTFSKSLVKMKST
jgi:hypothetical protein